MYKSSTFSSALHSTGPATIAAINQIEATRLKPAPTSSFLAPAPQKICSRPRADKGKAPLETIVTFLGSLSPAPSTDTSLLPVCADEAGSAVQRVLRSTSTALRSLLQHGVHWSPSTLERPTLYLRRAAATAAANQQVRLSNSSCKPTSRGQRPQPSQAIKANLISRPSKSFRSLVHLLGTANQPPENADFRSQAQTLSSNQSKGMY